MQNLIHYLLRACEIIERGATVGALRSVLFVDGRLRAWNGVIEYQAPSGLAMEERFALQEDRLAAALRASSEETEVGLTAEFLRLKTGPLSIRVRKLPADNFSYDRIAVPKSVAKQKAEGLKEALMRVHPFMSTDASRPWSISVMILDEYAYATNNLALVRTPCAGLPNMIIPLPMVDFLCESEPVDYWHIDERQRLVFVLGKQLVRAPQSMGKWPEMAPFFDGFPKKLPAIPDSLLKAAQTIERFSERTVNLKPQLVESKAQALEADYEIDFSSGIGTYSAKLLSLILTYATHADFSFYPKPIYFSGDQIEGRAVGVAGNPNPPAKEATT